MFLLFWKLRSRGISLTASEGKRFCCFICYLTSAGSWEITKVKFVWSSVSWLHSPSCLCSPSSPTLVKYSCHEGQVPCGSTCAGQHGQVRGIGVEGGCPGLWEEKWARLSNKYHYVLVEPEGWVWGAAARHCTCS